MSRSFLDRRALFSTAAAATLLAATGVSAAGPNRGGRLRMALSGASRQDSWNSGDGLFMQVARQGLVFDTLTEVAADGTLRSELALSWVSSSDARIWEFNLRQNVTFHDGSAFTAADVVRSAKSFFAGEVRALGPHKVSFVLKEADAGFPLRLSEPEFYISPAHARGLGIGTGLYRVVSFVPGQRLLTERVGAHYKDGAAGWFDEVELTSIPSENVRNQALAEFMVDAVDVSSTGPFAALPEIAFLPDHRQPVQAISGDISLPLRVGYQRPLDNLRAAERWWFR